MEIIDYYQTNPVVSGTTAKASEVNTEFEKIQTAFEQVSGRLNLLLEMPEGYNGSVKFPSKTLQNTLLHFNSEGQPDFYSLTQFQQNVTQVESNTATVTQMTDTVTTKHNDVVTRSNDVVEKHEQISTWYATLESLDIPTKHGDMSSWHQEISDLNIPETVQYIQQKQIQASTSEKNAAKSEAATAGYAAAQKVPTTLMDGQVFTIPEELSFIEIVCLGSATIYLPNVPGISATYIINSVNPNRPVEVYSGQDNEQSPPHPITFLDEDVDSSCTLTGVYQLTLQWLDAQYQEK